MIKLLDCTLRDGGLGLEDMMNYASQIEFSNQNRFDIEQSILNSLIDIVEIGSIEISEKDKTGFCIYQNIEAASYNSRQITDKHAILYRGPDTPFSNIPYWNEKLIKKVRVIIRYSELKKSIDFCSMLAKKGYDVCIQPMVTLRYTNEELEYMAKAANDMNAYALYFVDSYGCMDYDDLDRLFNLYSKILDDKINIGFHAHNNKNMAFANVQHFIELAEFANRDIIVDSTCLGMGQGAGNLQTELILPLLNEKYGKKYNFEKLLYACEIIDKLNPECLWGYSLYRYLPALYNTAYKYAVTMRLKYKMTFVEINQVLKTMPDELRQRYTIDNLEAILK